MVSGRKDRLRCFNLVYSDLAFSDFFFFLKDSVNKNIPSKGINILRELAANNVDPDQRAPSGGWLSGSIIFVNA